jgi:hypothetical protein
MAAVLYWRLPALAPTNPGPLPWLPGIPETLHAYPVWGTYLAKRSQLVADLADQVQDHARQGDGTPAWAAPRTHTSNALVGEIAVWRAANGINPQDPRPTGGTQFETLPALWKTTPRPAYRARHLPASRYEGRRATGSTHRIWSKRRHATPVPKARTATERAVRAQPIAHLSRQTAALET